MRLETISEADMSRRQFLKTVGKGAMAAAAPKQALKGLMGGTKTTAISYPKTPVEMKAWLLKLIKDRNLEQLWRNDTKKTMSASMDGSDLKNLEDMHVKDNISEILSYADPAYDEPQYMEDLMYVIDSRKDDPMYTSYLLGGPLPEWVTRYNVSQFMGREVGMDHPFVKDRDKWHNYMGETEYDIDDPKEYNKFLDLVKNSASPTRVVEIFGTNNPPPYEPPRDEDFGDEPEDKPEVEKPKQVASDDPDSWRTQSVEFEHKLVDRLRRL